MYTPSRKRLLALKLACPRSSKLETRSLDQVEARIRLVTLDGCTLSRRLMRHDRSFKATNVTHRPDSWRARVCPSFSSCPFSFSFLHLMKRKKEWRTTQGRSDNEARILVNFEKLSDVENDLLSPRSLPFCRWMNEFTAINASLENTQVPEKSPHNPKRSPSRGDERLTVAIKSL